MRKALSESEHILKDSAKLITKANKELTKKSENKHSVLLALLNREIEVLVKHNERAAKLRRELESRDKILCMRERILEKKKSLVKKLQSKSRESRSKQEALEGDIAKVAQLLAQCKQILQGDLDQKRREALQQEVQRVQTEYDKLTKKRALTENLTRMEQHHIQEQVEQCDLQINW